MAKHKGAAGVPFEEQLTKALDTNAPFNLPENAREWIVKYSPWIALVIGILLLPAVLAVIGLAGVVGGLAISTGVGVGPLYWLAILVLIVEIAILFIAFPGLRARKLSGWKLLYWGTVLNLVYGVLSWIPSPAYNFGGLLSTLIGALIGLYFLFQIKSKYSA